MSLGVQAACRPEDSGHSAAFFSFLRVFGQSIGVAISVAAFQDQIEKTLLGYRAIAPVAAQYSKDATALVGIIQGMHDGAPKTDLVQAYSDSLHVIGLLITVINGAALVLICFAKKFTLVQEHSTKQGFKQKERVKGCRLLSIGSTMLVKLAELLGKVG